MTSNRGQDVGRIVTRWVWPVVSLMLLLAVISWVVAAWGDEVTQRVVVNMFISAIIVVGLYIFIGNSGIVSFGHIGFMAIGAYTSAILTIPPIQKQFNLPDLPPFLEHANLDPVTAAIVGGIVAALFAAVLSAPLMRLSGIQAGIATLTVLIIIQVVALQWVSVTRGQLSMEGVPTDTTLSSSLGWALVAILIAFVFQNTRWGRLLRASRDDATAASSIGINVRFERRVGFILSAFVVGVGGAVFAHFVGVFDPTSFYLTMTFWTLAMLVIGGMYSLSGAIVGTVFVSILQELLRRVESGSGLGPITVQTPPGSTDIAMAAILLIVLILRPSGITGGREVGWPGDWIRLHVLRSVTNRETVLTAEAETQTTGGPAGAPDTDRSSPVAGAPDSRL